MISVYFILCGRRPIKSNDCKGLLLESPHYSHSPPQCRAMAWVQNLQAVGSSIPEAAISHNLQIFIPSKGCVCASFKTVRPAFWYCKMSVPHVAIIHYSKNANIRGGRTVQYSTSLAVQPWDTDMLCYICTYGILRNIPISPNLTTHTHHLQLCQVLYRSPRKTQLWMSRIVRLPPSTS